MVQDKSLVDRFNDGEKIMGCDELDVLGYDPKDPYRGIDPEVVDRFKERTRSHEDDSTTS